MEVYGRRRRSELDLASDEVCHLCQPCQFSGKQTNSKGFCKECEEYICGQCIKYHQSLKATRSHTILAADKDFKPQGQTQSKHWSVNCEKHEEEKVKFFCSNHSKLGCNVCMVLDHKRCDVAYIPDVAKDFRASKTFRKCSTELSEFETDVEILRHTLNRNGRNVEAFALREIANLKRFRDEINAILDKKKNTLLDKINTLKKKDEHMLEDSNQRLQTIRSHYQTLQKMFHDAPKDDINLFVSCHLVQPKLEMLQNQLQNISLESKLVHEYQFNKDKDLLTLLKSPTAFGTIALKTEGMHGEALEHEKSKACFDKAVHGRHDMKQFSYQSHGIGRSLNGKFVHRGVNCDWCYALPIIGTRLHKMTSDAFYLCDGCMSKLVDPNNSFKDIAGFETLTSLQQLELMGLDMSNSDSTFSGNTGRGSRQKRCGRRGDFD